MLCVVCAGEHIILHSLSHTTQCSLLIQTHTEEAACVEREKEKERCVYLQWHQSKKRVFLCCMHKDIAASVSAVHLSVWMWRGSVSHNHNPLHAPQVKKQPATEERMKH